MRIAVLWIAIFASCGCGTIGSPRIPEAFELQGAYSKGALQQDRSRYADALEKGNIATARTVRDEMLQRSIGDVDRAYFKFRNEFHEGREFAATSTDIAKLGMSAAATVLGGNAALSAAVTALEGTSLSLEKNFFREKTTEILFTTMDALRDEQKAAISTRRLLSPPEYNFEEAFNDAVLLFNAGTVVSALEKLAANAGKQAEEAKIESKQAANNLVHALLPVTVASVNQKEKLSKIVTFLASDPTDVGKLTSIKRVLTKRNVPFAATDGPNDLYEKLRQVLDAAEDDASTAAIVADFKTVGAWKE